MIRLGLQIKTYKLTAHKQCNYLRWLQLDTRRIYTHFVDRRHFTAQ